MVSYHTDPDTCGVARFSAHLAACLGIPLRGWHEDWGMNPLLSIKWAELGTERLSRLGPFDQLWHDAPPAPVAVAGQVWKLYDLGVPSLVRSRPIGTAPTLFTFGMAHKLDHDRFLELRCLLPLHEMPPAARRAIVSIETEETFEGHGKERKWTGYVKRVKLASKESMVALAGKHLAMFQDRVKVEGDMSVTVVTGVPEPK